MLRDFEPLATNSKTSFGIKIFGQDFELLDIELDPSDECPIIYLLKFDLKSSAELEIR